MTQNWYTKMEMEMESDWNPSSITRPASIWFDLRFIQSEIQIYK